MVDTTHIEMEELVENQGSPELQVNEALNVVDGFVFFRVGNLTQNSPPGSPSKGNRYIIGSSPSGDWSSLSTGDIALYTGTQWHYITAGSGTVGWLVWDSDTDCEYRHDGTTWIKQRGERGSISTSNPTTTVSINMLNDNRYWDLGGNITVDVVNTPSSGEIRVVQRFIDTNTYTVTWPSTGTLIDWGTAAAPVMTTNKLYWFRFIAISPTKVLGFSLGEFTP